MSDCESEVHSSVLGTKEYWDEVYSQEVDTFTEFGDQGEIWFGRKCERRLIEWICGHNPRFDGQISIVDLGCGNASFLRHLFYISKLVEAKLDFTNLTGVDYSEFGIELAKKIVDKEYMSERITLEVVDVCNPPDSMLNKFEILVDKGTFDAISLAPDQSLLKSYKEYMAKLLQRQSKHKYLVIASCNFTEKELRHHFCDQWKFVETIPQKDVKEFTFGGTVGKTVTECVFQMQ